jgi:anti-sigma28 factor (negative regulator of flagellin synthesis)
MKEERRKRETTADRARRIARLREEIASGRYFVPPEVVARSLLRRRGFELLDLQHR